MEIDKKRIRIDYAALNVAFSTVLLSPNSPLTQTYNGFTGEFDPDRSLSPTVILPQVVASAADGSWKEPYSNDKLANMVWLANGVDISKQPEWNNKFSINQETSSMRGALSVYRNLMPGEQISLVFKADLVDNRLGVTHPIETEPVIISTSDKSQNMYSVGIGDDQIIQYNPFKDKLFLHEYKVAHGLIQDSAAARAEATDENSYLREITVHVFRGDEELTASEYQIELYKINDDATHSLSKMTAGNEELVGLTPTKISLDLRLIPKGDYYIKIIAENRDVASIQFSVNRLNQAFSVRTTNGTAINPGDTQRYDEVMVDSDGNVVECPGSIIKFIWMTDTEAKKGVIHNEGDVTQFLLSDTGIGNSYNDSWMSIYLDAEPKEAHKIATDANGNIYTDQNGNPYIFN